MLGGAVLRKGELAAPNAAPSFMGESDLKVDSAWKRANLRVVAFVQKSVAAVFWVAAPRFEPSRSYPARQPFRCVVSSVARSSEGAAIR